MTLPGRSCLQSHLATAAILASLTGASGILLVACGAGSDPAASPPSVPPPPSAPPRTAPEVLASVPKPAAPPPADCQLLLKTTVAGKESGSVDVKRRLALEAMVENRTAADLEITITHRCPDLDVRFTGFGDVSLYDNSCMAGVCAPGSDTTEKVTVPAGKSRSLARTELQKKMPCGDHAVAPGTYSVSFALPAASTGGARTCAQPASVTVE